MRLQLALNVKDLEASIAFYAKLFGAPVNKRKPGYANFAIENPPLKLVLFENPTQAGTINHLGVEAMTDAELVEGIDRLKAEGLTERLEEQSTCCYATQSKAWTTSPDGTAWEWYKVIKDSETFASERAQKQAGTACC